MLLKSSEKAGVGFINIEDSLNGVRLCDTKKPFVTGIAGVLGTKSETQESFHPNHLGNKLIANVITLELKPNTLLTHRYCPSPIIT